MQKKKLSIGAIKFLVAYLVALAMIEGIRLIPASASTEAPAPGAYTPGTYSAAGIGFGGNVTATLTIGPSGSIDDVELDGPDETPALGGQALPTLREQVLSAQSAEIDGVSGASLTSNAVKDAVSQALAQASGSGTPVVSAPAEGSLFVPGTYTKSAKGFGGDCTVTLTVSDNEITDVQIDGSNETENIGSFAVTLLQQSILENQTTNVDAISVHGKRNIHGIVYHERHTCCVADFLQCGCFSNHVGVVQVFFAHLDKRGASIKSGAYLMAQRRLLFGFGYIFGKAQPAAVGYRVNTQVASKFLQVNGACCAGRTVRAAACARFVPVCNACAAA